VKADTHLQKYRHPPCCLAPTVTARGDRKGRQGLETWLPGPWGGIRNGLLALSLLALAGCAGAPPPKHVLLAPPAGQITARPSDWEVSRVQVPEYLDNYNIELRSGHFVLSRLHNAKWAVRLPVAMTQLLQKTINQKLMTHRKRPYRVAVTVDAFEPRASGQVLLAAHWQVTNRRTDATIAQDQALIRQPLPVAHQHDPEQLGRAMSAAVRKLAYQIVSTAG
jgi:uncharacterized lipoprotein YmbA